MYWGIIYPNINNFTEKSNSVNIYRVVLFCVFLGQVQLLLAQTSVVSKVIDASTKESLIYCHVLNLTTSSAYITNAEGEFRINQPRFTDSLLISYVGYNDVRITVKEASQKKVILLAPNAELLTEVKISLNDKKLLKLIKDCAETLDKSPEFYSKAYLELYSEDESTHLELLQMHYNVRCKGGHIPNFFMKAGRVALTDQADKLFVNLGSTQALALLNPVRYSPMYPVNPLLLTIDENIQKYYIRKISESDENDVVHLEFEPKIMRDSSKIFSGEMWIRKSDKQLLKLNLKINNSLRHPFLPIRPNDTLQNVSFNLNYHFNKIGTTTRLTLLDFRFGLKYLSASREETELRHIETEGLVQLYDDKELFVIPFFKYDQTHNDYRKMSLIPTDSLFWAKSKTLQVTEKQQKRYDLFAKNGVLLNFSEIKNQSNIRTPDQNPFEDFFEFNNVIWNKNSFIRLKPNVESKKEKADIAVQLFLDINKFGDSLYHNSHTILDLFKTEYNLVNNPEHLTYLNLYFDHCEIIRREMEVALNKTQSLDEMLTIYDEANAKIADRTKKYKKDLKFGHNILNFPPWNEKVKKELDRDLIQYFGLHMPAYNK